MRGSDHEIGAVAEKGYFMQNKRVIKKSMKQNQEGSISRKLSLATKSSESSLQILSTRESYQTDSDE